MKNRSYSSFVSKPKPTASTSVFVKTDKHQIKNNDGAFVYNVGTWDQVDRFLILGASAPTYYASQRELVKDNANVMISCIREDGKRFVNRVVEISLAGRAPKNDPALFALALAIANGNEETKTAAYAAVNKVARIGTHLFHLVEYVNDMYKWRAGVKRAIGGWFNDRKAESLAYQIIKYRQRDGWSMRDVIRLAHPKAASDTHNAIYHYITKGWESIGELPHPDPVLRIIWGYERAKLATNAKEVAKLVRTYKLPWEALDTKWLNDSTVWDELIQNIKPEALMRNLARLTANKFIDNFGSNTNLIVAKLTDQEALVNARLHPFKILTALKIYAQGRGDKGSLVWTPNQKILNALDDAYYLAHKAVEPTNKNIMLAIDVSGSTSVKIGDMPFTVREAEAAVAMTIAKTEPNHAFYAFSSGFSALPVHERMRLDEVTRVLDNWPFQGTDCSLPFIYATQHKMKVDAFIVLTDSETNSGVHPKRALDEYRQKMGIDAKSVVVGMTATKFTIADPNDRGMLDVVGMDTAVPELVSNFIADRFATSKPSLED